MFPLGSSVYRMPFVLIVVLSALFWICGKIFIVQDKIYRAKNPPVNIFTMPWEVD